VYSSPAPDVKTVSQIRTADTSDVIFFIYVSKPKRGLSLANYLNLSRLFELPKTRTRNLFHHTVLTNFTQLYERFFLLLA